MLKKIFGCAALTICMFLCVFYTAEIMEGVKTAVYTCLNVIIPSMFGFMLLSEVMVETKLYRLLSYPFSLLAKHVFCIPRELFSIFLLSLVGGYPVGIKMLRNLHLNGEITNEQVKNLSICFFGAGPTFVLGTVAVTLFHNTKVGIVMFLSCVITNFIILLVSSVFVKNKLDLANRSFAIAATTERKPIVSCVNSAWGAMLTVCGMILAFSVFSELLRALTKSLGVLLPTFIPPLIDVTNILYMPSVNYNTIPFISALLSFGGLCVIMQVKAIGGDLISIPKFIFMRLIAGGLSYLICTFLLKLMLRDVAVDVMAHHPPVQYFNSSSALASVLLILLSFMLLGSKVKKA